MNPSKETYVKLIKIGYQELHQEKKYKQANILRKLRTMDIKIAPASLSNILNDKDVGLPLVKLVFNGLQKILQAELSKELDYSVMGLVTASNHPFGEVSIIEEWEVNADNNQGFTLHEKGRFPLFQKLEIMDEAKHEIIELGVRLHTFTNYFLHRSDHEFKDKIVSYLQNGINIKLFLINPIYPEAKIYFDDRGRAQDEERSSPQLIENITRKLKQISKELSDGNYPGKFQIYTYRHIPYCRFLIIDGGKSFSKLYVSHYLYGKKRAASPVLEIHRSRNFDLYQLYWESFQAFVWDAVLLEEN